MLNKLFPVLAVVSFSSCTNAGAQCLSSVNPVGGSNNLLVQERRTLRLITFYRYNYGNQYFEGDDPSDFNLLESAYYNYAGIIAGYGLLKKITLEAETGYFINKTQNYNIVPDYSLRSNGFSNYIFSVKYSLLKNDSRRFFVSSSIGAKLPFSTRPLSRKGVELPVEMQPSTGAYGAVIQLFVVKEKPATGMRYFLTGRMELNTENKLGYKPGTSVFTSCFLSKHLMFPWLKGDWTAILQIRNEIRSRDKILNDWKESSGSTIFYISPQVNYLLMEKWNLSLMLDLPVYQNFKGTQLATKYGLSLNMARDFKI